MTIGVGHLEQGGLDGGEVLADLVTEIYEEERYVWGLSSTLTCRGFGPTAVQSRGAGSGAG